MVQDYWNMHGILLLRAHVIILIHMISILKVIVMEYSRSPLLHLHIVGLTRSKKSRLKLGVEGRLLRINFDYILIAL